MSNVAMEPNGHRSSKAELWRRIDALEASRARRDAARPSGRIVAAQVTGTSDVDIIAAVEQRLGRAIEPGDAALVAVHF